MSEIFPEAEIDQYYNGKSPTFITVEGGQTGTVIVRPHLPEEAEVLDCAAAAEWRLFTVPRSTRQFEGLVFNPYVRYPTHLVALSAGGYNKGHMHEGALWAAQNPHVRIVYLPALDVTPPELAHYRKTGRLCDEENRPLPSMSYLARALRASGIVATAIYGRSAGTKQASVLPQVIGSIDSIVLGEPSQFAKLSLAQAIRAAQIESSSARLRQPGYEAHDPFQVSNTWMDKADQARKSQPERPRQTGNLATAIGDVTLRLSHLIATTRGPVPFIRDLTLNRARVNVDLVLYQEDAFYRHDMRTSLVNAMEFLGGENGRPRARAVLLNGNHRMPEAYPSFTNDLTDALLATRRT